MAVGFGAATAHAHINGKALVNINGIDVIASTNPYSINDQAPELYETKQVLTFYINKIALPASVPADATFQWSWGDDTPDEQGRLARHTYTKAGTYHVKVLAQTKGSTEFTRLDIVEVTLKQQPRTLANVITLGVGILVIGGIIAGLRWAHAPHKKRR
ncbi:MAG TPA: PKD domain-containing protein [Candidatus Saccharimonadales bacterium]|nr:PKD domain-containing protein [Candidatus Saccharimonadales bacterium]